MRRLYDTAQKLQAFADGGKFTYEGVETAGRTQLFCVRPTHGGVLMRLTQAQAEIWISGYVTGIRNP